jgi:hypothetical protein
VAAVTKKALMSGGIGNKLHLPVLSRRLPQRFRQRQEGL